MAFLTQALSPSRAVLSSQILWNGMTPSLSLGAESPGLTKGRLDVVQG